jgi:putative membrane protein
MVWKGSVNVAKKQGFWYRLASGFVIGFGMVVPGVSGGVLAMVLGLYEPIIAAVAKPLTKWRENVKFLAPLGIGAAICLLFLARVLEYLFAQYPMATLYFFFGLVMASFPSMVKLAHGRGFRLSYLVSLVLGLLLLKIAVDLPKVVGDGVTLNQGVLRGVVQGSVLGVGLVIPGLSVSFLLIAFGFYEELLGAVVQVNLAILVPVVLGLVPALILVSKAISWLFQWKHGHVSYAILGLMLGSLWVSFPGWPRSTSEFFLCLGLFVSGVWIASLFLRKQME